MLNDDIDSAPFHERNQSMHKLLSAFTVAVIAAMTVLGNSEASAQSREVTLHKNPGCQCCDGYADYLRENGFTVTVKPTHDLAQMSRAAGIPDEFQGCHLSQIDGYVVSGHVPVETVNRLLSERPDIAGVSLPGMPLGSPGMSGVKTEPFTIYEIGGEGSEIYAVE
jgi:hypothetical protein